MSGDTPARERWNERYGGGGFEPFPDSPAAWLVEHRDVLGELATARGDAGGGRPHTPVGARGNAGDAEGGPPRALDVACGDGRNARWLAELGFAVDAVDVSDVAVGALRAAAAKRGLTVDAQVLDLERDPLPAGPYDVVVCMSYLQRDLFGALSGALAPGGLLLFETFAQAHLTELGRSFNPAYVLEPNELLRAFAALHVRHYREGVAERGGEQRGVAGIVAQRLV